MRLSKFLFLFPIVAVVLTIGLWIEGRGEYERSIWLRGEGGSEELHFFWTDHTAFPIQVAGMLSIPVATFATPLYPLAQGAASEARLLVLLLAVAVLWAYIGWRFDNWKQRPSVKSPYRQIIGTVLGLFSIIVLVNTVEMFHVGLVYKAIGIVWAVVILRHSFQFFKRPMKEGAEL
jgi:hypothetical protein